MNRSNSKEGSSSCQFSFISQPTETGLKIEKIFMNCQTVKRSQFVDEGERFPWCCVAGALPCTGAPLPCAGDLYSYSAAKQFGRHPCSQLVSVTCVACACSWLSHPRPPDRNQHASTVGVLPGPTRVVLHPSSMASVAERQLVLC